MWVFLSGVASVALMWGAHAMTGATRPVWEALAVAALSGFLACLGLVVSSGLRVTLRFAGEEPPGSASAPDVGEVSEAERDRVATRDANDRAEEP